MITLSISLNEIIFSTYFIDLIKISLAIFVGFVLGKERKKHSKNAGGSRTMSIVCLTACLISLLTQKINLMSPPIFDYVRLMAYGIVGMGFLGSGVIIQNKNNIDGVTTASTLFALMPIGYLIGLGLYFYGLSSVLFIYFILEFKYWRKNDRNKNK